METVVSACEWTLGTRHWALKIQRLIEDGDDGECMQMFELKHRVHPALKIPCPGPT